MAPMKDVTDVAFRALIAKHCKPDVFWTEFVAADGLYHTIEKYERQGDSSRKVTPRSEVSPCGSANELNPLLRDLAFDKEAERPIVAQIFSSKPEMIAYATKLVAELGFDGVDINMGCPDRAIEKQGCGSAMIKNPELAREIIRAAKSASTLPVSVKTRVGYNKESLDEWLPVIFEEAPAAITIHLRTRKELSLVPANWELMKKAVEIRNRVNPDVLIIGNGDVESVEEGKHLVAETGCDGIMIGRAMFGNPWIFSGLWDSQGHRMSSSEIEHPMSNHGLPEKLDALIELAHNFEKISPPKNFSILKKHIKAFVTGFAGAADLRAKLMEATSAADLERIAKQG
ncbi:MAG: tRNA-dihydrouridine synthase family protein [Candidatus Paceibacterota bacterium]